MQTRACGSSREPAGLSELIDMSLALSLFIFSPLFVCLETRSYVWGEPVMGSCSIRFKLPSTSGGASGEDFEDFAVYSGQLDSSGSCFTAFNTSTLTSFDLPLDNTILFEATVVSSATQETQEGASEVPIKVKADEDDERRERERERERGGGGGGGGAHARPSRAGSRSFYPLFAFFFMEFSTRAWKWHVHFQLDRRAISIAMPLYCLI